MQLTWLNIFQLCKFLRALGHIMVLIVLSIIGLCFYTVVIRTCVPQILSENLPVALGYGAITILFSLLIFMILWSYFAAVLTDPGSVPDSWHPFLDDETAERELESVLSGRHGWRDQTDPRRPRFCQKCNKWKPQRAHHCSVSRRCILKMDHYCIWVVNCIGLLNYKFFLLFLIYTWLGCFASLLILLPSLIKFFSSKISDINVDDTQSSTIIFVCFVINAAFVITLLGFLGMHIKLLTMNCSSIEMYEKQRSNPWPYDKGILKNIEEVFGIQRWLWPFPFNTESEIQRLIDSVIQPRLFIEVRSTDNNI